MIEWRMRTEDVIRIRFAYSPLMELVLSLMALRAPREHSANLPWVRETRPLVAGLDLAEVYALVPVRGWMADFISFTPTEPQPDIATELDRIRRTPPPRVISDLADTANVPDDVADRIRADPRAATARIADTLETYWDMALAQHWPSILRLLEADVWLRSKRLADGGLQALFDDLHESVSLRGDRLSVVDPVEWSGDLTGTGLTLVPHAMGWPSVRKMTGRLKPWSTDDRYQPMIAYPARGVATLWETTPPPPPDALAGLIGRTRATILVALAEPATTTSLAGRLGLTPGGVSQHLSILSASELVARTRVAGTVLYHRTTRGDALVG
jgi:DNA-binding transcriptional ArsR family regulator